ncbi:hypothetical protein A0H81_07184 [Grifola frondosa]|uniref:GmrSD restriction endonucleases N-terminal domain-containing protein n=1 Tax=Grifola frondosa TaxID=5627 RepID=A0A1C7M7N8_GRIFR|nr:hypothetical protein A0H81_07184 [Grifola frondosa]
MKSDSDLTDFDDEDDIPLATQRGLGNGDSYRIRGALKVPRATTYTTQSLYDQIISEDIGLNAEYQRDVVWPDAKQIGLIDSIFRNFYVPPVIFAVKYNDDGSEHRVCIDGKQRLTSIYRFMDGLIPYKDAFSNEKFVFKETGKIKAKILSDKYRKIFCNKQIVCMEYQDLNGDNEREIFQRVQLGMALTPAEKLQAINSPTARFIRELQTQYVVDGLSQYLDWDVSRGSDFRGLAMAVYNIEKWPGINTLASLNQVQKWLQQPEELDEHFCDKIHATFRIFVALAKDSQYNKCFKLSGVKKVSPVEFMAASLLIAAYKNKLTFAQLSEAIILMRKEVRASEVDIRMNTRVVKPMVAFIKNLKVSQLTPSDGEPAAAKHVVVKRKRTVDTDMDVDEEDELATDETPPARATTSSQTAASSSSSHLPPATSTRSSTQASEAVPRSNMASPLPQAPTASAASHALPASPAPLDRLAAVRAAKLARLGQPIPRVPPSEPAALRLAHERRQASTHTPDPGPYPSTLHPSASFPSLPSLPPFPAPPSAPRQHPQRQNSLGDSLMARMTAPSARGGTPQRSANDNFDRQQRWNESQDSRSPNDVRYPPFPNTNGDGRHDYSRPPLRGPEYGNGSYRGR